MLSSSSISGYLVSIIIPAYNAERYIARAVSSCLNQTFKNIEIIVVDDGSTDNTAKVVLEFAKSDERVKYLYQNNAERSAARNYGLDVARGDFIQLLDADDELLSNKIIDQLSLLFNNDYDCVFSPCFYQSNRGRIVQKIPNRKVSFLPFSLLESNFITIQSMLFRRSPTRFPIDSMYTEDWLFWLKYVESRKVGYLPEPSSVVYIHDDNTSHDKTSMIKGEISTLNQIKKSLFYENKRDLIDISILIREIILGQRPFLCFFSVGVSSIYKNKRFYFLSMLKVFIRKCIDLKKFNKG